MCVCVCCEQAAKSRMERCCAVPCGVHHIRDNVALCFALAPEKRLVLERTDDVVGVIELHEVSVSRGSFARFARWCRACLCVRSYACAFVAGAFVCVCVANKQSSHARERRCAVPWVLTTEP